MRRPSSTNPVTPMASSRPKTTMSPGLVSSARFAMRRTMQATMAMQKAAPAMSTASERKYR